MPFASIPAAEPVTHRDKRKMVITGVIVLAIFAGVGIWAAVRPGAYGASRHGCITVTVPSSTGAGLLHGCGSKARALCRTAYLGDDKIAQLTRQQCRLAGIKQSQVTSASPAAS